MICSASLCGPYSIPPEGVPDYGLRTFLDQPHAAQVASHTRTWHCKSQNFRPTATADFAEGFLPKLLLEHADRTLVLRALVWRRLVNPRCRGLLWHVGNNLAAFLVILIGL